MSLPSEAPRAARDSTATLAISLLVALTTCALLLVARPRPVRPLHLPPLVLDDEVVAAQRASDRALAARAPRGPEVDEMYALFLAEGRAERQGQAGVQGTAARRARMSVLSRTYLEARSRDEIVGLRARDTERFMEALMGQLSNQDEADGLVGTFPNILRRYGLLAADLTVRAPELSLRAMYKARWNMIHELPVRLHLERGDLQAYDGWNALHAAALAPQRRADSAKVFYEAGGRHGAEAYATWLFAGGHTVEAAALFEKAFAAGHELRVRNKLIATRAGLP